MHFVHIYSPSSLLFPQCLLLVQMQVLSWQWITLKWSADGELQTDEQTVGRDNERDLVSTAVPLLLLSVWSGFGSIPDSFPELKPHSSPRLTSDPSRSLSTALLSVSVSSRPNRALALLNRQWMKRQYRLILLVLYTKMTNALSKWHVPSWLAGLWFSASVHKLMYSLVYTK